MRAFNFKKLYLIIFLIPFFVLGDYKNTNGKAINKPLKDLLKWQLNKAKTNIGIIDISEDWKNFDLNEHDNYFIWIETSTPDGKCKEERDSTVLGVASERSISRL